MGGDAGVCWNWTKSESTDLGNRRSRKRVELWRCMAQTYVADKHARERKSERVPAPQCGMAESAELTLSKCGRLYRFMRRVPKNAWGTHRRD
jgi:hypothetical protein